MEPVSYRLPGQIISDFLLVTVIALTLIGIVVLLILNAGKKKHN